MPAFNDPTRRSGAAKSKEEAEGYQACATARYSAGSPTGKAQAAEHGGVIRGRGAIGKLEGLGLADQRSTAKFAPDIGSQPRLQSRADLHKGSGREAAASGSNHLNRGRHFPQNL